MSTTSLKKESSYHQFRRKNSLSKNSLHKSLIDIENTISLIADQKTQQLSSIEQQLQNIVRKRSLSNKPHAKSISQSNLKITIAKNTDSQNISNIKPRRNSLNQLNTYDITQKSARSINLQGLSQTFEIIHETEMHNQQDNGFNEAIQQGNNNFKKVKPKYEKSNVEKKKEMAPNKLIATQKFQSKTLINDLDEMQKRLESTKKLKQGEKLQKKIKKQQASTKPGLKNDKRLMKTASQNNFFLEQMKPKASQALKQKQLTPKLVNKKKLLHNSESTIMGNKSISVKNNNNQNEPKSLCLIPTKMVSADQKQKLCVDFNKLILLINSSDICIQNVQKIRKMMKNIEALIN